MPLLIPVMTILMLLVIGPCIINCLTHFVSAHVNKLQYEVRVQQGYIKLHPTMENITNPQMDTAIRTLRLEIGKRVSSKAPRHPSLAGSSQRDLMTLFPKNSTSHFLRGKCQIVKIGKRSPKWWWLKEKQREKPKKKKQKKIYRPQ